MNNDSKQQWNPIETAPLDGTYLHLRGCYYSATSIVEVIGFYDMGGHTEGWCDERGNWFSPTEWKAMNAPLASIEERYQDLLNHLGVQGHDGAIAEIKALRKQNGLDVFHNPSISKEELIKILFANNINVKSPIIGINEENLILFALPNNWKWQQDDKTKEYFAISNTEEIVTNADVVDYLNNLQKSYDELNARFIPVFPKSKIITEPGIFESLVNCFKNSSEQSFVCEIIPQSTYRSGMQMLPPVYVLNSFIADLIVSIKHFNSADVPMPTNKEEMLTFLDNQNGINTKVLEISASFKELIDLINKQIEKG